MSNVWDYVNSISYNKKDLMTDTENDQLAEKGYVPFVVNRGLSYFPDTLFHVNIMNKYSSADNKLQYDYLLHSIRPKKRFSKWATKRNDEDINNIKQYYKVSTTVAESIKKILTADQLKAIKSRLNLGGIE